MTTSLEVQRSGRSDWPCLPQSRWHDTRDSLQRWPQIVEDELDFIEHILELAQGGIAQLLRAQRKALGW